jgi:hypothetical protein
VVRPKLHSPTWLMFFVLFEMACQIALLFQSIAGARTAVRTASFVVGIVYFVLVRGPGAKLPAGKYAFGILLLLGLGVFHPETNSITSGLATVGLYFAILSPIFWVPNIAVTMDTVRRLMLVTWLFNAASAAVGALQVYFPGRFQPATSSVLTADALQALQITLANGQQVYRPMGLTDTPGGASVGAMYAIVFAAGFLVDRPKFAFRVLIYLSMALGCFTLYLSQVRSMLVMLAISLAALAIPFVVQNRMRRFFAIMTPLAVLGVAAFGAAVAVGGDVVTDRLGTLLQSDPGNVYYSNRGIFLEYTFYDLLPEYPVGAGLGRWGMIYSYFSDHSAAASRYLWAEINWTAWLYDGGVPLMVAYTAAMISGVWSNLRATYERNEALQKWAALILGYTVGTVALTFNSVPFAGTTGMEFWLLTATVFAAQTQASNEAAVG